jgi:hypothetical protein
MIMLPVTVVSETFKQVNIHKATGPDGLPGHVLGVCADQLFFVYIVYVNIPLN